MTTREAFAEDRITYRGESSSCTNRSNLDNCDDTARFCRKVYDWYGSRYARGNFSDDKATMLDFKGSQFERDIILWGVRWYVAYPISYRQLEEMMQERGVEVDHSSLNRWVIKYTSALDKAFRQRKRSVGISWRMALALGHPVGQPLDETYMCDTKSLWKLFPLQWREPPVSPGESRNLNKERL